MRYYFNFLVKFLFLLNIKICPDCFAAEVPARLSCSEYTYKLEHNQLSPYQKTLSPEDFCAWIPENCGRSFLFFNPKGMTTFHFRSECYFKLALKTGRISHCNHVKERHFFFQDGSYYSPENCQKTILQQQKDASNSVVLPSGIITLSKLEATFSKNGGLTVKILWAPGAKITGKYALALTAHYETNKYNEKPVNTVHALNPNHALVRHDTGYARLNPVNNWIIPISFSLLEKGMLELPIEASQVKILKQLNRFNLVAKLQFLESESGQLADKAFLAKHFESEQKVVVEVPH